MDFTQFLLIIKARRRVVAQTFAVTVLVAVAVTLMLPKVYKATATIVVDSRYVDPVTGVQMQGQLLPAYLTTQVAVITSHSTALRVVKALGLDKDPKNKKSFESKTGGSGDINDWLADQLLTKLRVEASHESNDITISYPSHGPEESTRTTNAFVDAYIQTNVDLKAQPAKQTAEWFGKQIEELGAGLAAAQTKLADYQNRYGVVIGDLSKEEPARLQAIVTQHVIAQAQGYGEASKAQYPGGESADAMKDPVVQALNSALAASEAKVSQLAKTEGVNNPEYQSALAEYQSLNQRLARQLALVRHSVEVSAAVSKQSEAALREAVAVEKRKVLSDKAAQGQGQILLSEVTDAQKLYDLAVSSYKQNQLLSKANQTDVSVLSRAFPPNAPAGPSVFLSLLVSAALGILLGIGYALALESMDRKVRSKEDLAVAAGLPVLGVVVSSHAPKKQSGGWTKP